MNNKINVLIDTNPYIPDIFNNTPSLYENEEINDINCIPTYQTIFVFSLNYSDGLIKELNKYNNPYYMLYGVNEPTKTYLMPPINYFSIINNSSIYSNNSNLIKVIDKSYIFTPEIIELLTNMGYDTTPISETDKTPSKLFPPSIFPNPPNNSTLYDNKILYQKLLIYDAITGRTDEIIFLFFYQNYITDNPIHLNNSYNNLSLTPFSSSVYYNKKNWNVFIYPYTTDINYQYITPEYYLPIPNILNTNTNNNFTECLNFCNKDYVPYIDKLEYKYFENTNFVKTDNKLNTMILYSKNSILFGDYYKNKIEKSDNNIFISLNEIKKYDDNDTNTNNSTNNMKNINNMNSISENTTLKFLSKSKSYSNINKNYSLTYDNKMSYINNKYNKNDLLYAPYYSNTSRSKTTYSITKNFFVNTYINILNTVKYLEENTLIKNDLLQTTNWYIRKLLLQINPLIIYDTTNITTEIYEIVKCKNLLEINPLNNLQVSYVKDNNIDIDLIYTNNYYIDRYRLVVKWTENNFEFVFYIILNIAYYNKNKFNISNITKSTLIDDLGFINFTYLEQTNTLSPVIFENLKNSNIYVNLVDFNLIDFKYYSTTLNYNLLSSNTTQHNLIFLNHFYYLIPYVKPTIYYSENENSILISNMYNLLEKKINNFISNIIFLSDNFYSIKFNNYNSESILKLSITFDTNILKDYEENPNIYNNYINFLSYISNDFSNNVELYINNTNNYPQSSIMIPSGNYLVFKYHNNFVFRNSSNNIVNMSDEIINEIFTNLLSCTLISSYNYALLIKLDDDFNPDDAFFYYNQSLYTLLNNYMLNQGNYQSKIYLVPCDNNYDLYYYGTSNQIPNTYLVGLELFNYYNGIINTNNYFTGNKIFINLIVNKYMNFYQLNFIIDTFDIMKENNQLCFDKNNLFFKIHKTNNNNLYDIIKYDSQRFNSNIYDNITFWDIDMIKRLYDNKNLINYFKVLNNNIIFILNCNKIINLLKRCIFYLRLVKSIIYFELIQNCNLYLDNELCNIKCNKKWKNHLLSSTEYINIINYLATCCININKTNQILNITFCYEITDVDTLLMNLVYITPNITIQNINDFIINIERSMIFYVNRIKIVQDEIFKIFKKIDKYEKKIGPIINLSQYKKEYIEILKEIYINDIILYAINQDIYEIFKGIKINVNIKPKINEFIVNNLMEITDILEINKLNINILLEVLNFVRLFYTDNTVYGIYPPLNDNIIKTNYILNTTYYNQINNLPNINIFTYFPPNPLNPPNLSDIVKTNIITLIQMISDTYKINYTLLPPLFGYNIYTKPDFINFVNTLDELILNSNTLFLLPDVNNLSHINKQTYIYSWDIIVKFISNCNEIKTYIKSMFYLNKIKKHILHNKILCFFTDIENFIVPIENIYSIIQKIITEPSTVITQYQEISNLLLEEISTINTPIFSQNINYNFIPYNQYQIMIIFLKILYELKFNMLNNVKTSIFNNIFNYYNLGYQGEDIIPYNDYNLLIDEKSLLYTVYPTQRNIYIPTANMHSFNSNLNVLELIKIFNHNKKFVNDYFNLIDNSLMKYSLIFNSLNYGFINTDYIFININNVNT
jgi:hypothetical protein